ncbi:MAG: hypothetical protein K2X09_04500 [Rickettsiales bacterium]|nr:hypothetical protein [Rickettsiales bacterium]
MSNAPAEMGPKERNAQIARILAEGVLRMRATPMNHFGKNREISLDYEVEQSVYAPNK